MTKDEMNSLVDNMSGIEKNMMFEMIVESVGFEEFCKKKASWLELKDIPYELIESEEVPNTPLMRNFLYTFEFCRRRYIEESNFDELVGYDFDNDKFLFLLRHNFGIGVDHDADWTLESLRNIWPCWRWTKRITMRLCVGLGRRKARVIVLSNRISGIWKRSLTKISGNKL